MRFSLYAGDLISGLLAIRALGLRFNDQETVLQYEEDTESEKRRWRRQGQPRPPQRIVLIAEGSIDLLPVEWMWPARRPPWLRYIQVCMVGKSTDASGDVHECKERKRFKP
jgi:hypothetical protein